MFYNPNSEIVKKLEKNDPCPCKICICKMICNGKSYSILFKECSILQSWLPHYDIKNKRSQLKIKMLWIVLKTNVWHASAWWYDNNYLTIFETKHSDYEIDLLSNQEI